MSIFKKLASTALVLLASACVSIEGIEIGGLDGSKLGSQASQFQCDNGYKVMVSYKGSDEAVVSFKTGKDTFIDRTYRVRGASGDHYANRADTLRWHEKNGTGVLTYPDSRYRTTGKLWDTACRPR